MTGQEDRFRKALDRGHSAAWDQDWGRAATYYQQALDERPHDVKALTSLALALYEMREYAEALEYYSRAAELSPEDPVAFEKKAVLQERLGEGKKAAASATQAAELYLKRQDVKKAIENWSRAVGAHPEHLRAHARLAVVYEQLGQKSKAASEYLIVASLLQHTGKKRQGQQAIERAMKVAPEHEKVKRAVSMLRQGIMLPKPARPHGGTSPFTEERIPQLEASSEKEEKEAEASPIEETRQLALSILAQVIFEDSEDDSSHREDRDLSKILSGSGGVYSKKGAHTRLLMHVSQAIQLQTQRNFQQAAEELRGAISAGLDHPAAHYNLGYLYLESDQVGSALKSLRKAVTHANFALGTRLLMGQALRKKERWAEASTEYLEALKLADASIVPEGQIIDLHRIYEPLIDARRTEKDQEKQVQLCDNIENILLRSNWKEYLEDIREQFSKDRADEEFIPLADVLLETHSNQVVDALTDVQQLARKGLFGAAMEKAFYALELAPQYLPLHTTIGDLLLKKDQVPAAIRKFLVVADAYRVQGKTERAISTLNRVVELIPMDIDVRQRLINLLVDYGRVNQAIEEYVSLAEVYYSLAELDNARESYAKASGLVEKYHKEADWQARILHRLADIDTQRLEWKSALEIFERICTSYPGDEKAYLNVITLHHRLGEDDRTESALERYVKHLESKSEYAHIVEFLETLREEMPQKITLRRRLASAYENQGRIEEAIAELDTLGELLLDAGQNAQASEAISKIIDLRPPNVEQYQQLLAQMRG